MKTVLPCSYGTTLFEDVTTALLSVYKLDAVRADMFHLQGTVSRQLTTRTIPHHVDIGSDEWFYWLVLVIVGSCPSGE